MNSELRPRTTNVHGILPSTVNALADRLDHLVNRDVGDIRELLGQQLENFGWLRGQRFIRMAQRLGQDW